MPDAETMRALIERVEQASGHDAALAKDIARALGMAPEVVTNDYGWREDDWGWWYLTGDDARVAPKRINPLPWLTSLDAAASLVPDGLMWFLGHLDPSDMRFCATVSECGNVGVKAWRGFHATPALALVAAALRARLAGEAPDAS